MPPIHRIHRPGEADPEVITDHARLYTVEVTANAEEGSVATSTQLLDDGDAGLDLSGRVRYEILESTATGSNQYIWVGTTGTRTYRRGDSLRTGVSREVEVELHDINTLLSNYILTESWANRPAETDVARVQAVVANGVPNLGDSRFVSTASPVSLPANDFRGQTTYALLDDCAQESGKNWFIWHAADVEESSLWYDFSSSTSYSSIIRLSNVLSDIDEVWTFPLSEDTELARDPSRVFSHIYLPWQNGAAFVGSFPTQLEFSIVHGSMDGYNVKTQAQATARAARYLQQASTEEDVVTTTVRLPAAKVNFLMQGMRVQFRATHLPGYEDAFTWMRVLRRTVTQEDELNYSVRLEMTGTPSAVALSCAAAIAGGEDYTTGNVSVGCHDWSAGAIGASVGLTPATPSAIVAAMSFIQCSFQPGPFTSVSSPYTMVGPATGNLAVSGYRAATTTGGTFAANFTGGDAAYRVLLAASIPTSASAPANTGAQISVGSTVTMSGTPTVGNLLVCVSAELRTTPPEMVGWTTLAVDDSQPVFNGTHGVGLRIQARCVAEGDTTSIAVPGGSNYHSSWVTEWPLL